MQQKIDYYNFINKYYFLDKSWETMSTYPFTEKELLFLKLLWNSEIEMTEMTHELGTKIYVYTRK